MIDVIVNTATYLFDLLLHIDAHLAEWAALYGPWIFGILFVVIFCETGLVVTPFLPGDSLLFVTGALAATGAFDIHLMVLTLVIAAILGDSLNYFIGRRLGIKVFASPKASRFFKQEYLDMTNAFYEKHGGKAIVIARFVPIVRTFAPFVAGVGTMHYSRFAFFNVLGAIIWVTSLCYVGYFFGNLPIVQNHLGIVIIGIVVLSLVPVIWSFVVNKIKNKQ